MKIYLCSEPYYNTDDSCSCKCGLVLAEVVPGGREYRVHHPENGYSVWPVDQFEKLHRALTRHEAQLINQSVAELELMAITDTSQPGELTLVDGHEA